MTVKSHDMTIALRDDTEDGRFLKSNTAANAVKAATQTKTEKQVSGSSTPKQANVFSKVGAKALDNATGGIGPKLKSTITSASPLVVAMTALTMVEKIYSVWRKRELESNNWENTTALRAGGASRGEVNRINQRANMITGKISGNSKSRVRG